MLCEKFGLILAFEFTQAIHNLHYRLFSLDSPSACGNESAAILAPNALTHYTLIFLAIGSKTFRRNKNDQLVAGIDTGNGWHGIVWEKVYRDDVARLPSAPFSGLQPGRVEAA